MDGYIITNVVNINIRIHIIYVGFNVFISWGDLLQYPIAGVAYPFATRYVYIK